jgi:hypothetical protein
MNHKTQWMVMVLFIVIGKGAFGQNTSYIEVKDKGVVSLGATKIVHVKRLSNVRINIEGDEEVNIRYQSHIVANQRALATYFGDGKLDHYVQNGVSIMEFKKTDETVEEESWIKSLFTRSYNNRYQIKQANIQLQVPKGIEVLVDARYSDVIIQGMMKLATLTLNYGKVDVKHHESDLMIKGNYGKIKLNQIRGKATISSNYSDIDGVDLGSLQVKSNYSKINLSEVGMKGGVSFSGNYTTIEGSNIYGTIMINGNYNDIELRTTSQDHPLQSIVINNTYGNIRLTLPKQSNPSFNLSTVYGNLEVNNTGKGSFTGGSDTKKYLYDSGTIPKINLINRYGNIKITK